MASECRDRSSQGFIVPVRPILAKPNRFDLSWRINGTTCCWFNEKAARSISGQATVGWPGLSLITKPRIRQGTLSLHADESTSLSERSWAS